MKTVTVLSTSILLLVLAFSACKKKKVSFTVEGTVTNTSFAENFAGLKLKVEIKKASNSNYTEFATLTTDANGKYSFDIENGLIESIRITAEPNLYFPIVQNIPFGDLTEDKNVYNLKTTAKAWARLIFNNVSPAAGDELVYSKQDGKQGCDECCPIDQQSFFGPTNDTVICINDGNTYYSYLYSVIGTTNTDIVSVYTPAFDTAEVILNY